MLDISSICGIIINNQIKRGERVKKILIVHTGGTIGCFAETNAREMSRESANEMRQLLVENFKNSASPYAEYYTSIQNTQPPFLQDVHCYQTTLNILIF